MKNKNALFKFFVYMKLAKKEYLLGSILMIITSIFSALITYIISRIFDDSYEKAIFYAKVFITITIFNAIFEYYKKYYLIKASNKLYSGMQTMIYDHIQALPIKYFDNMPAGSVVSRTISDTLLLKEFFENTLIHAITVILRLLSIYIILFFVNPIMALVLICFLIFMIIIKKIYEGIILDYTTSYREYNSKCSGIINESLQNLDIIKAFNNEENILNEWRKEAKNRKEKGYKLVKTDAKFLHNLTALARDLIFVIAIIYYAYSKFTKINIISVGLVYLFIRYTLDVIESVTHLVITLSSYSRAIGAAKNLDELLNLEKEKKEIISEENKIKEFKGDVIFKDVVFSYNKDNKVLDNITFEIKENQTVAFVGRTGSGKSTIMNLLSKFYSIDSGEILVSGKNINEISKTYLRENVVTVFQDSFLFEGTLLENITINEKNEKLALETLENLGAMFLLSNRDLNTQITVNGSNLSEGEKQLIAFARALSKNPKILILDEATANIDSETERYIQDSIERLKNNRTTIIIAHRLSTIKNADKIFVLDKGKIVESGNHEELLKNNGIYANMYKNQR